jgi:hypothetical protein
MLFTRVPAVRSRGWTIRVYLRLSVAADLS